jgi:hypothetical protein
VSVLGPIILDLNSVLLNINSLFFLQTLTTVLKVLSECISIKFPGRTYAFYDVGRFEVLSSGIAGDMSSGM